MPRSDTLGYWIPWGEAQTDWRGVTAAGGETRGVLAQGPQLIRTCGPAQHLYAISHQVFVNMQQGKGNEGGGLTRFPGTCNRHRHAGFLARK